MKTIDFCLYQSSGKSFINFVVFSTERNYIKIKDAFVYILNELVCFSRLTCHRTWFIHRNEIILLNADENNRFLPIKPSKHNFLGFDFYSNIICARRIILTGLTSFLTFVQTLSNKKKRNTNIMDFINVQ